MLRTPRTLIFALTGLLLLAGPFTACGGDDTTPDGSSTTERPADATTTAPVIDPGDGGKYVAELNAADVVEDIDNPYMPLVVGARWHYEGDSDGEIETTDVVVTADRKQVMGISAVVVRDTVAVAGDVVEDTYDWFVQDTAGNVWYLGEEVKDYENGKLVSTAGSWEAGVDGAQPGIVMPAHPAVGDVYRQEFYPGEAEDMMEILAIDATASVPAGEFTKVVTTRDWNPLEPEAVEEKSYAPGVGLVREEKVAGGAGLAELHEHTPGP